MPEPSNSLAGATVAPPWVHRRLKALPDAALDYVQSEGLDAQWLRYLLEGLGEHAPPVPTEALSDLVVWLRAIVPPRRFYLAFVAAHAIGVHAQRHGWPSVKRFLNDYHDAALPPYLAFGWMLRRLMAGANAVDAAAIDEAPIVQRTQLALEHLFAGCDLIDLGGHVAAWETFVVTGGQASGDMPPAPVLFDWVALAGGEVIAMQLATETTLRAAGRVDLWPVVASGQGIAVQLDMGQPMHPKPTFLFRPTLEGHWKMETPWSRLNPEFQLAAMQLGEMLASPQLPHIARQAARDAAARRARYSPTGALYSEPQHATPAELAAVDRWFPPWDDEDALRRLRRAWDVAGAHLTTEA